MTTVVNGGGGGGATAIGIIIGLLIAVLVLFYVFGGQVFDGGGSKSIDVDVNLPKVEQPAK